MYNRTYIINTLSFLLILLPIALLTGPFLPDLLLSIICIIFIFISIKEKLIKYYQNNFFYLFLTFNFILLISSFNSTSIIFSLETSSVYFRFGIFSLAVWFLIDNNQKLIKLFTITFLFTFITIICCGYYQYFYGSNPFGIQPILPNRLTLLFNDKMYLGGYITRLLPLLIGLIIFTFRLDKKTYLFVSILLMSSDILIYITGERTALGLLFFETLFLIVLISKFKVLRFITFIISIIAISVLTFLPLQINERNINQTIEQLNLNNESQRLTFFSNHHESMMFTSLNIFYDNLVLGSGPNTFRKNCNNSQYSHNSISCDNHPHNNFIQLLAETGVIGFIFVFSILMFFTYKCIVHLLNLYLRNKSLFSDYQICLICCFLVTLFPFLPTQNFFNNWINIVYFLPVGFYLHSIYKDRQNNSIHP